MDKADSSPESGSVAPDGMYDSIEQAIETLVKGLVRRLSLGRNASPAMMALLRRVVMMADRDRDPASLTISGRSLARAALSACLEANPEVQGGVGNSLIWTTEWLYRRFSPSRVDALYRQIINKDLARYVYLKAAKELSIEAGVNAVFLQATAMARRTGIRGGFGLRHLLIAVILNRHWADVVTDALGPPGWDDQATAELCDYLVDSIMESPIRGETRQGWAAALAPVRAARSVPRKKTAQRSSRPAEQTPAEEPSQIDPDQLTPFNNDLAVPGDDLLDTGPDVRALSRLAALKGAAPLAMAIFGGWGAGKSSFMARMEREIDAICADDEPAFVRKVVHIRFNAWQFADANIWASLTAEFFDQLRAGGHGSQRNAQLAKLVERVNAHVHSLSRELEAAQTALADGRQQVQDALEARTKAQKESTQAFKAVSAQSLREAGNLIETYRIQLNDLRIGGDQGLGETLKVLHEAATSLKGGFGWLAAVWKLLARNKWRLWFALIAGAVFSVALIAFVSSGILGWTDRGSQLLTLFIAGVSALQSARPAVALAGALARSSKAILEAGDSEVYTTAASLIEAEQKLQQAIRNAEIQEATYGEARTRLSRYVDLDQDRTGNPPRLLRYVLEDDPDCRSLESEIGLIGRARRLFLTVDEIIRRNADPEEKQPDPDLPERIVIYIDDLDRCSFDQVYAVLQAVHLLLAFESFVVVVGVDPAWVQGTLTHAVVRASGASLDREVTAEHRHKAALYLDKIFQVALWLNPLDSEGDGGGTFGSFVRAMCVPREPDAPATPGNGVLPAEASRSGGDQQGSSPVMSGEPGPETAGTAAPIPSANTAGPPVAASGATDARTTGADAKAAAAFMRLDEREIAFLASDTIARICEATPRTAKRMVNSYRLLRSRLAETGRLVLKDGTYQALAIAVAVGICSRPGTVEALQWRLKSIEVKDLGKALGAEQLNFDELFAEATEQDRRYLERMRGIAIIDAALIKELTAVSVADFSSFLALALRHACSLEAATPAP